MAGFGRRISKDERDKDFSARGRMALIEEPSVPYRYWSHRTKLDQLLTGTCVSHGCTHLVENAPICPPGTINPFDLYREIVLLDEWSENDYEANGDESTMQFGTSVRAGMKALRARGLISEYRWAFEAETAARWLWTSGPVVIGVNWYREMSYPDPTTGVVEAAGILDGGHCVCLDGVNMKTRRIRFLNSWGSSYGNNGVAWMSFDTLSRLLGEDGEAAMAVEIPK